MFIDEIDKIARRQETMGADVSREGVQRDLLPLVEGSTVSTKYGQIKTDHILFIASGAFHMSKPSDLIPELQGRFPIRVELDSLKVDDFVRILTEPDASLTAQYKALMGTEKVDVKFATSGVRRIAEIAFSVNEKTENIGARRLHTVMERLLETVSFDAAENGGIGDRDRRRLRGPAPRRRSPRTRTCPATFFKLRTPAFDGVSKWRSPDENRQAHVAGADADRRGLGPRRGLALPLVAGGAHGRAASASSACSCG